MNLNESSLIEDIQQNNNKFLALYKAFGNEGGKAASYTNLPIEEYKLSKFRPKKSKPIEEGESPERRARRAIRDANRHRKEMKAKENTFNMKLWKRQSRKRDPGFREKYQRYEREETSVWYRLARQQGKSRISPLEEWLASGIDKEYFSDPNNRLVRLDTSKDWTLDNLQIKPTKRKE